MSVSVVLPRALAPYSEGTGTIVLSEPCATVRDALVAVSRRWPALTDRVLTEQGEIRRHVNVFVGAESVRFLDGLSTPLDENDTLTIVPAVSGG